MSYICHGHFYATKNDAFADFIKYTKNREKGCNNLKKVFTEMLEECDGANYSRNAGVAEKAATVIIERLVKLIDNVISKDRVAKNFEALIMPGNNKIISLQDDKNFEQFSMFEKRQSECYDDLAEVFCLARELYNEDLILSETKAVGLLEKAIKVADTLLERDKVIVSNIEKDYLKKNEVEKEM